MDIRREDLQDEEIKKLNIHSDADKANALNAVLLCHLIQCDGEGEGEGGGEGGGDHSRSIQERKKERNVRCKKLLAEVTGYKAHVKGTRQSTRSTYQSIPH